MDLGLTYTIDIEALRRGLQKSFETTDEHYLEIAEQKGLTDGMLYDTNFCKGFCVGVIEYMFYASVFYTVVGGGGGGGELRVHRPSTTAFWSRRRWFHEARDCARRGLPRCVVSWR